MPQNLSTLMETVRYWEVRREELPTGNTTSNTDCQVDQSDPVNNCHDLEHHHGHQGGLRALLGDAGEDGAKDEDDVHQGETDDQLVECFPELLLAEDKYTRDVPFQDREIELEPCRVLTCEATETNKWD